MFFLTLSHADLEISIPYVLKFSLLKKNKFDAPAPNPRSKIFILFLSFRFILLNSCKTMEIKKLSGYLLPVFFLKKISQSLNFFNFISI